MTEKTEIDYKQLMTNDEIKQYDRIKSRLCEHWETRFYGLPIEVVKQIENAILKQQTKK